MKKIKLALILFALSFLLQAQSCSPVPCSQYPGPLCGF